ncbi:hypothetical protein [Streptomyces sp. SudanB52_2052]|uniref:hypothetical protein n=1 Tax=Streptomyces sp. SudanB52_2052 TaxID=3035276 RepID=UPI003F558380
MYAALARGTTATARTTTLIAFGALTTAASRSRRELRESGGCKEQLPRRPGGRSMVPGLTN